MNNCPSRWTDLASAIQVTWTAPVRPNGILLRYHLQLTTYDGRRVTASENVGSGTLPSQLDSSELRESQHKSGLCLYKNFVVTILYVLYISILLQLPQRLVFPTLLASLQRTQLAMEPSVMSLTSQMNYVSFTAVQSNIIHGSICSVSSQTNNSAVSLSSLAVTLH